MKQLSGFLTKAVPCGVASVAVVVSMASPAFTPAYTGRPGSNARPFSSAALAFTPGYAWNDACTVPLDQAIQKAPVAWPALMTQAKQPEQDIVPVAPIVPNPAAVADRGSGERACDPGIWFYTQRHK
jgi:hypothetical protein